MSGARTPHQKHTRHNKNPGLAVSRRRRYKDFLSRTSVTLLPTATPLNVTVNTGADTFGAVHNTSDGDGPYVIESTGSLPGGIEAGRLYWVHEVDASNFAVGLSRREAYWDNNRVNLTSGGSGTIQRLAAADPSGLHELMRQGTPAWVMGQLTDIDALYP